MKWKIPLCGLAISLIVYILFAFSKGTVLPENSLLFGVTTFLYLGAGVFYLTATIFEWGKGFSLGSITGWGGFCLNIIAFIVRWIQTHKAGFGYVPLSNLYESLVFFGASISGLYLFWEFKLNKKFIGAIVFILASFVMAFASLKADASIKPLIPALKSNWLVAHVITCFLGYGAFAVSFGAAIAYLVSNNPRFARFLPEKHILDAFIYRSILFGFFWLTLGIITGSVWAEQAWGSYWSWDPKETWSFITWLIYAGAIHLKLTRGWSGKKLSWMSILGFLSVLFTYFGVNFLLSGLHSYASL